MKRSSKLANGGGVGLVQGESLLEVKFRDAPWRHGGRLAERTVRETPPRATGSIRPPRAKNCAQSARISGKTPLSVGGGHATRASESRLQYRGAISAMLVAVLVAAIGSSLARGEVARAAPVSAETSRLDVLPSAATATPSSTTLHTTTAMMSATPMHSLRSTCTSPSATALAGVALRSKSTLALRGSGLVCASLMHAQRGAMFIHKSAGTPTELDAIALLSAREKPALRFGETIAAHAGIVVIGTPTDGDDALTAGRVAVGRIHRDQRGAISFERDGELIGHPDGGHFGCSLALSSVRGDVVGAAVRTRGTELLAIGSDRASVGALLAGSVEIYCGHTSPRDTGDEDTVAWTHEATIVATHGQEGAEFGHAIDFADTPHTAIAIGAPRTEFGGFFDSGAVHVFTRAAELRVAQGQPLQPATHTTSAQSDDGAIPAQPNANTNTCNTPTRWRELHVLHAPTPNASASFGAAVALGNGVLAVGSPRDRVDDELVAEGAVYLFAFDQTTARVIQTFRAPRGDNARAFGASLSIEGTTLAIGAPLRDGSDDGSLNAAGAVYLVDLEDLGAPMLRIDCPAPTAGAGFGHSVVLADNTLLIGAPGVDGVSPDSTGRPLIEDLGAAWVIDTSSLRATYRLRAPSLQPSSLFGTVGAIMRASPDGSQPPLLFMGHLYVEEEAFGPSPGVGVFALP